LSFISHPAILSAEARARLLLKGELLVQRQVQPMLDLCEYALNLSKTVFQPFEPEYAHQCLSITEYSNRITLLCKAFSNEKRVRQILAHLLDVLGIEKSDAFCDRFVLRIVPPEGGHQTDRAKKLWAHRDTWCSNVYQQINLWAPICPISRTRTITLFPDYWLKPIANNSEDWDIAELRRSRHCNNKSQYPTIPSLLEETRGVRVSVIAEPGDMVAFSGTHLHESTVDDSLRARISFDFRVVNLRDMQSGLSAPNCDGRAKNVNSDWFCRFTDNTSLLEVL